MMRHLVVRAFIALCLLPAAFGVVGVVLAHGVAHHRDHHEALHDIAWSSTHHSGSDHEHPRLDQSRPVQNMPALPVPAVRVHAFGVVTSSTLRPEAWVAPDPHCTGPPPRLRSPPLV